MSGWSVKIDKLRGKVVEAAKHWGREGGFARWEDFEESEKRLLDAVKELIKYENEPKSK